MAFDCQAKGAVSDEGWACVSRLGRVWIGGEVESGAGKWVEGWI